ncbi:MAG: hypothetical protein II695_08905 [Oscillospiraceae bacterium]|nr:hypothetical protein [Oscillospiraceae bacterium]
MPSEKKGITVKVDAELHAQVREYIEAHGMTMGDFVAQALDNELHPKIQEGQNMSNMRTMAFQVPQEMFDEIKDYLNRHHMKQKDFVLGLIRAELDRDQQQTETEEQEITEDESEDIDEADDEEYEDFDDEDIDESDDMTMGME